MSIAPITSPTTNDSSSSSLTFRAFSGLNLSEDQRTQIRSIVTNALEQGTSYEDVESQISAVLTPAQQATLAQHKAAMTDS